jgi:predicted RNase H-like HicB family nuclease
MTIRTFTAIFRRTPDWWLGYTSELPGANTQGKTLEEARENLREAIQLILEDSQEQAEHDDSSGELVREELAVRIGE